MQIGPTTTAPWRRPDRIFIGAGLVFDAALWAFYMAAIVFWAVDLDYGPLQLVLLGTVLDGVALIAEVPTGVLADRFSRKWSVVLSFVLMAAAMVLSGATTNYAVMLSAQGLFALGWTFRSGAEIAWLTDELAMGTADADDEADHDAEADDGVSAIILRRHRLGLAVGLATTLLVIVFGGDAPRPILIGSGLLLAVAAVVLAIAMTDHFRASQSGEDAPNAIEIFRSGVALVRTTSTLRTLVVVMVLLGLGSEALDRLAFDRFLDTGAFGDDALRASGLLLAALAVGGTLMLWAIERRLASGTQLVTLIVVLALLATAGATVAAGASTIGLALGMMLQDAARESLDPVTTAWANESTTSSARATVLSFIGQADGVGRVVGGPLLAGLAELTSIRWAILAAAALWGCAALVARRADRQAI